MYKRQDGDGETAAARKAKGKATGGKTGIPGKDAATEQSAEGEARTAGNKSGCHDDGGEEEEVLDKKKAPCNFSKVDPSLPRAELAERFPLFLEAESCAVEVEAGQMLFLPAGWFHEVRGVTAAKTRTGCTGCLQPSFVYVCSENGTRERRKIMAQ